MWRDCAVVQTPVFAPVRVATLVRQYGGLNAAAAALGYSSVGALQNASMAFCEG
jgi:hypothetical protein